MKQISLTDALLMVLVAFLFGMAVASMKLWFAIDSFEDKLNDKIIQIESLVKRSVCVEQKVKK